MDHIAADVPLIDVGGDPQLPSISQQTLQCHAPTSTSTTSTYSQRERTSGQGAKDLGPISNDPPVEVAPIDAAFLSRRDRVKLWELKAKAIRDSPKPAPTRVGKEEYGTAVKGSLTALRAQDANMLVDDSIQKLLGVIRSIGRHINGNVEVTFGELFQAYQEISGSLVGYLIRAKKRSLLSYEGTSAADPDMLWQKRDDHVIISVKGEE